MMYMTNEDLLRAALLCSRSYIGGPGWTCVNELCYGVFYDGRKIDLCFRGTQNIKGWLHDFDAIPVRDWDGSWVHKGFFEATNELWPSVMRSLNKLPPAPITVIGHSLGGAHAVLAGKRLKAPVITFGCPRVQLQADPAPVDTDHWRVVVRGDPVTHVGNALIWYHTVKPYLDLWQEGDEYLDFDLHAIDEVYVARLTERVAKSQ